MTRLSPFVPAGVQLFYHSAFGVHTQTLPTLPYLDASDEFETWGGGAIDAEDMITALITTFLPLFPDTVVYDSYRIFTQGDEESLPFLRKIANLTGLDGTSVTGGWSKAVQGTLSALGEDGSKARITLLDSDSNNDFSLITSLTGAVLPAIMDEWGATTNGWSTRGDSKPNTFLEYSKTLNEALRREYRMF